VNEALAALEEHFRVVFADEGIEDTREHQAIVRAFCRADSHLTLDDLVEKARAQGVEVSSDTARHVMSRICEYGLAREVKKDNGTVVYEHLHLEEHHDHMICTRCKRVINFYDRRLEDLQAAIAAEKHFYPLHHRLEIYGLCSDCLPRHTGLRALTEVAPGERVHLVNLAGGHHFSQRLADLGLVPETEIQVLNNTGPVIIALGNTRIALGRGMAGRIFVR